MKRAQYILAYSISLMLLFSCDLASNESTKSDNGKIVIYQVFTRLFGSDFRDPVVDGYLSENGVGKFSDFTSRALDSIAAMGMTHIWYTGVIEHASIYSVDTTGGIQMNHPGVIKGKAGSPYAIKDYYDVNGYLADEPEHRMEEMESLVDRSHQAGMKVIIDFVPNHVARGYHSDAAPAGVEDFGKADDNSRAFDADNNFYYIPGRALKPQFSTEKGCRAYYEYPARATGNDQFSAEPKIDDWYETVKLNYGVDYQNERTTHFDPIPNTWLKMRDILLFWASKRVDGFRCDMAEMVPCQFWHWAIAEVKKEYPDIIFIAEIYNPEAYEEYVEVGGFDYLYDKVGLYDTLKAIVHGEKTTSAITANRAALERVQGSMLNFLENHDEQRVAWHEFAGCAEAGIAMMAVSALTDNIPVMMYFGQELGEQATEATGFSSADGRTTIFDFWSIPLYQSWRNGGKFDGATLPESAKRLRSQYISLIEISNREPLFKDGEYFDLTEANPEANGSVYAFCRYDSNSSVVVATNLSNKKITSSYTLPSQLEGWSVAATGSELFNNNKEGSFTLDEQESKLHYQMEPYQVVIIKINR